MDPVRLHLLLNLLQRLRLHRKLSQLGEIQKLQGQLK